MSERMKARPIKRAKHINIILTIKMPDKATDTPYQILPSDIKKVRSFLECLDIKQHEIDPWEKAARWEALAKDKIEKYKKAGIVLRGARYREGISQRELSKMTGISQDNISKIENGKRTIGEKVARKLAKVLQIDYHLLLET